MGALRLDFNLRRLEHEVGRVDLAVGVGVTDSHDLAAILEYQHVLHAGARRELAILSLPGAHQPDKLRRAELGQAQIVPWSITDDPRDAPRRAVAVDARWRCQI